MKIAFWLIPAEPDYALYQSLIQTLAQQYCAPVFTPHVTLHSCELDRIPLFPNKTNLILEIDRISDSESFTKSLFIQLIPNSDLNEVSKFFRQNFPSPFKLNPHLSLIYANLSESEKRSRIPQIPLNQTIHFTKIRAVKIPDRIQTREDIEAFQEL